ncbi:uncharacterized protein TRUGW13939_08052 [Talaromyces rugulosus]|uniref:F-box domain-containing protein n=1 Tax=Talaromyces rugulosus TaxID=121627 RepID=A0A7H8R421_TALRU|nr:uncharacterized protein TRUGW13939_08052 [Talaromyces rugulosus]QKX60906.1 hypothetical protein TRUGW13939_08052 [Talaromyces rugulosus]
MTPTKALSALEKLPVEILEAIIVWLQFPDICSLRLVSRTIAAKSVQKTLKGYFASKTVDWTSATQVQELVQLTQPHRVGCLLQNLSIIGTAPSHITPSNKDILTEAFINLRLNSVYGGLKSIILSVQGRDDSGDIIPSKKVHEWKLVWQTASQTFKIACRALADSALHVERLDVFASITRCSLACNKIAPVLDYTNMSRALANLTSVSLSLSHHIGDDLGSDSESESFDSIGHSQRYTSDIRRFLELCSHLETLELHWYNLPRKSNQIEAQKEERHFFNEIVKLDRLSQIRHCRLYGTDTNEAALVSFCKQATQLCSLTLEYIHLTEGKYEYVFNCLANQLPNLDYLHLGDLYEQRVIYFDDPGTARFSYTSGSNGPEVITRTGVDCQHPIGYHQRRGRPKGSPGLLKWTRKNRLLYGPPDAVTSYHSRLSKRRRP